MNKTTRYILFFLSGLLFVYTFAKACLLPITWDEAYSYLEYIRKGIVIQEQFDEMSANNHLLITWFGVYLVKWFGAHELVLRLPSLMAHLLFLIYSAKLVRHFNTNWLVVTSFLIINLNPYLVDFFSLARGYGLSMGLMMTSLYHLYVFHKEFKNKFALLSLFTAALAVLANYVLLNYAMAVFGVIILLYIYQAKTDATAKRNVWKNCLFPTLLFILLLIIVLPIAFELRKVGALYYGANNGFWKDTIHTIVDRSFYELGYSYWLQRIAKGYIILILAGATFFAVIQLRKKQLTQNKLFLISLLLLLGSCSIGIMLQHQFLGTLYLVDRTALFFVVLFSTSLVFFINELSTEKPLAAFVSYVSAAVVLLHMLVSLNLSYVLEWKPDADTKEMLSDLEKLKKIPAEKSNVSISIPLLFETGINFYRDIHELTWLNSVSRSKTRNSLDDYYYLSQKQLAAIAPDSIEILKTYPVTQNVLAKPKYRFNTVKVAVNQELNFENEPEQRYFLSRDIEFSKGITYIVNDSITPHRHAVIIFEIVGMPLSAATSDVGMVITMENSQGAYLWNRIFAMDYMKHTDKWVTASFSCIVPAETKAGDKLSMYLWNYRKQELLVKKMQFKWLEYQ